MMTNKNNIPPHPLNYTQTQNMQLINVLVNIKQNIFLSYVIENEDIAKKNEN